MTRKQARQLEEKAEEKRTSGEYVVAGDYYSQAAFERAGVGTFVHGSSGSELHRFLDACTCYRVGGADEWCTNRARMGEVLAEELAARAIARPEEPHAFDQAMRSVWYEFVGDFRMIGGLGRSDWAYDQANETYLGAGDPLTSAAEGPIRALMGFFYSVATAAGADMDEVYESTRELPFSEIAEYKRERLPEHLETVVESGSYLP